MKSKRKEQIERFSEAESRLRLFDSNYCGFPYWQYLRLYIFNDISIPEHSFAVKNEIKKIRKKTREPGSVLRMASFAIKGKIHLMHMGKCEILELEHSEREGRTANYYKGWSYPKEITVAKLHEYPYDHIIEENNTTSNIYYMQLSKALVYYWHKLTNTLVTDPAEEKNIKKWVSYFNEEFGLSLEHGEILDRIKYLYYGYKAAYKWWNRIFDKTCCRAMVVVCYYQEYLYPAYKSAHERGIKIIELQHGVATEHPAYWLPKSENGWKHLPDYMLTFGEAEASDMKLDKATRAIPTGFPYHEMQIKAVEQDKTNNSVIIIYPDAGREYEKYILELTEKLTAEGFKVMVKLHPNQVNHEVYYPLLTESGKVEFITDQSKGIYYWLKYGRHHIVTNSTVGLQCASIPGANIFIPEKFEHFGNQMLIDFNLARTFRDADDLLKQIKDSYMAKGNPDKLWAPNAAKNMEQFFLEMKKQNWPSPERFVFGIEKRL